jgi:prepilin-type processing-associated H-X9-DG protein
MEQQALFNQIIYLNLGVPGFKSGGTTPYTTTPGACYTQVQPVKNYLCPSRRNTSAGPLGDYGSGLPLNWFGSGWLPYWSVLAAGPGWDGVGTTIHMVLEADGTSNTLMLAHKGMQPLNYQQKGTGPNDAGWAAIGCCSSSTFPTGKGSPWEHKRYPYYVLQDVNGSPTMKNPALGNTTTQPMENLIGSPHVGGMPALFVDGSVHNLSYSINQGKTDNTKATGLSVIEMLWTYSDGQVISDPSL